MNQCVSCGMPLNEQYQSKFDEKFCIYCQNQDDRKVKTYDEVRKGTIDATMRLMGKSLEEATIMADTLLPNLPYWKK